MDDLWRDEQPPAREPDRRQCNGAPGPASFDADEERTLQAEGAASVAARSSIEAELAAPPRGDGIEAPGMAVVAALAA